MKKTITLSIADPCHEDWAKMSATEKGKHCQVCSKEVVDFTNKSDEDIVKHVMKNKNACGRFILSQIDRELTLERKSGQRLAPIAASFLLPFTMLASSFSGSAKSNEPAGKEFTSLHIGSLHKVTKEVTIKGFVYDADGVPIVGANVTIKETGKTTITVIGGEYSIEVLSNHSLVYSHLEHKAVEFIVGTTSVKKIITLQKTERDEISKPHRLGKIAAHPISSKNKQDTLKNTIEIKGTVMDDTGLPLPGVNVLVKGTKTSTQTDFDGNYKIKTKPKDILVFNTLGFEIQEILVSTISNQIDIQMTLDEVWMGEIIITGGISLIENGHSIKPFGNAEGGHNGLSLEEQEKRKQAQRNTIEFKRIKKERRKAERQAKKKQ